LEKKTILEAKNLRKYFGGIKAVDDISLKLYKGEIIGIVGDNGAGKSTLIKIISGVHKKDSGEVFINGEKVEINDVRSARVNGVETVYQDQLLIQEFDVAENLFLGREKRQKNRFGKFFKLLDFKYMKEETEKLLERIGIEIKDADSPVGNLSGGQRQGVVVGRAVYWGGRILIFDEPTNNLGAKQEKKVMNLIKLIRNKYNISIIIISHNIAHVFELVDRIIILRNGKKIGERIKSEFNKNEIVSMITGLKS